MLASQSESGKDLVPRYSKPRSSGLKEVSVKSNRSIDSFTKDGKGPSKQKLNSSFSKQNSQVLQNSKNYLQNSIQNQSQSLEFCMRPQNKQSQNTLILDGTHDSRIIQKIHSTEITKNHSLQTKSKSIKIGSKAQKYRQNNKSQPKKVFDLDNLSSVRQKQSKIEQSKEKISQPTVSKNTQRKKSHNIFVCTKNPPASTEIGNKLKKFQEDLKRTKKPHIMKLQLETTRNTYKIPETKLKGNLSLTNHQIQPKIEPYVINDIKISPSPEAYCNRISNKHPISQASKFNFSYGQPLKRQQISALQKTKKITSQFIENFEMVSPRFPQQTQKKNLYTEANFIEGLMPMNEMKFVLDRLCSDSKNITESRYFENHEFKPPSIESIQLQQQSLKMIFPQRETQTSKKQVKIFTFKDLEMPKMEAKQALTLRATDCGKKNEVQNELEESAISQRRNTIFKTNEKKNGQKGKIYCLNEGAKTIITKYDSSQKRSVVDESIIIFQCSKDLKQSFSRQVIDTYAAKYRGSLGVETLIRQKDEDQFLVNQQNSDYPDQSHDENGFQNVLFNSNSNNGGKLRKSYSIKEVEASINF